MIQLPTTVVMGNQGNDNLHEVFFPLRTAKVLIFPLQMLHKILITKLLKNVILPSIQLHVPFSKVKSQWWSPYVYQNFYITQIHRPKYYCCSLRRGNRPVNFCDSFLHEDPRLDRRSLVGGPSTPVSFQDHLLHHRVWEAETQSTTAPLWLWRLSPEFEALPTTGVLFL